MTDLRASTVTRGEPIFLFMTGSVLGLEAEQLHSVPQKYERKRKGLHNRACCHTDRASFAVEKTEPSRSRNVTKYSRPEHDTLLITSRV